MKTFYEGYRKYNMDKTWSIEDVNKGARTVKSIVFCIVNQKPSDMVVYINHFFHHFHYVHHSRCKRITDVLLDLFNVDI